MTEIGGTPINSPLVASFLEESRTRDCTPELMDRVETSILSLDLLIDCISSVKDDPSAKLMLRAALGASTLTPALAKDVLMTAATIIAKADLVIAEGEKMYDDLPDDIKDRIG